MPLYGESPIKAALAVFSSSNKFLEAIMNQPQTTISVSGPLKQMKVKFARLTIFSEIDAERDYQQTRWEDEFDDENTLNDWGTYINMYAMRAACHKNADQPQEQRKALIKVAALAVAAVETFDRNQGFPPRHYDPQESDAEG